MSTRTHRKLSPAERQARYAQQRDRLEQACRELLTSDGWRQWVKVRSANGLARYTIIIWWRSVADAAAAG
jgi:hypothetical protein